MADFRKRPQNFLEKLLKKIIEAKMGLKTKKIILKYLKIKKTKKGQCASLGHPVISIMAFVTMFWDENWTLGTLCS